MEISEESGADAIQPKDGEAEEVMSLDGGKGAENKESFAQGLGIKQN